MLMDWFRKMGRALVEAIDEDESSFARCANYSVRVKKDLYDACMVAAV